MRYDVNPTFHKPIQQKGCFRKFMQQQTENAKISGWALGYVPDCPASQFMKIRTGVQQVDQLLVQKSMCFGTHSDSVVYTVSSNHIKNDASQTSQKTHTHTNLTPLTPLPLDKSPCKSFNRNRGRPTTSARRRLTPRTVSVSLQDQVSGAEGKQKASGFGEGLLIAKLEGYEGWG